MIIRKITTEKFLALRDCTISTLDEHLNFFVGPNGSGKTSLFRALKVLKESFEAIGSGINKQLDHLYSTQANPQQLSISIEVSWNTDEEKMAICAFIYAALTTTSPLYEAIKRIPQLAAYNITTEKYDIFTGWLREQCAPEKLQFLFHGELQLTYSKDRGTGLNYKFKCKQESITLSMAAYPPQDGMFWKGTVPVSIPSWKSGTDILLEYLFPPEEPPAKDKPNTQRNKNTNIKVLVEKYFIYPQKEKHNPLDMESFLLDLSEKHGYVEIGAVSPLQTHLPEYLLLTELSGIHFSQENHARLSCGKLFSLLLSNACIFTNNVFIPFNDPVLFNGKRVFSLNKALHDENDIPYWLLGIKNGTPAEKKQYQRIQDTFTLLVGDEKTFDISVNTHIRFSGHGTPSEVSMIDILVTDAGGTFSMASQGSGLWEALILSVFLDNSTGRVISLDEPAASLHPNMQRRLIEMLHDAPGQMFLATHSASLLPTRADRLQHVYRFQKNISGKPTDGTRVFSGGSFLQTELAKAENKFAASIDIASLLFTNGVLLVEGATEVGAFSVWIAKEKGQTLADMNFALYSTGGKNGIPFYLSLLNEWGIPYAVICDGDALIPWYSDRSRSMQKNRDYTPLWKLLKEHCPKITMPQETDSFQVIKREAAKAGLYTYDISNPIEFEEIPEVEAFLRRIVLPKRKADTVYEARFLAESIPVVPPLAKKALNQAIARLEQSSNSKRAKKK